MRQFNKHSDHQAFPVRPRLEELESRDVPSYLAAEFPGQGVWLYSPDGSWRQLTAANASLVAADSYGEVVAEFPGQGVWACDFLHQWHQLTANNAVSLDLDYSVWHDSHLPWITLSTSLVVAEFPGQGLWECAAGSGFALQPGTWTQLTANNASTEAINNNGAVVAEFPGQGVWLYSGGWQQLTSANASILALAGGAANYLAAEFPGQGVWAWDSLPGHTWQQLTPSNATALAVAVGGQVAAAFPGYGVWSYNGGWNQLTAADAGTVGIDYAGTVFGQFPGWGIWMDNGGVWQCLTSNNPSAVGTGGKSGPGF